MLKRFPYLFQLASYHIQGWSTIDYVHQFLIHREKAGKITTFYQIYGVSFNFIAVQDKGLTDVEFDTKNNKHKKAHKCYIEFKAQGNADALEGKFTKFEKELFEKAEKSGF